MSRLAKLLRRQRGCEGRRNSVSGAARSRALAPLRSRFPVWLRTIVRHHAFRVLRRKQLEADPLTAADNVPSDEPLPDHRLEQRQQAAAALSAIAELPDELCEPATLFFVHECPHQDIATFLNLPVTTVNNRLHAARSQLTHCYPIYATGPHPPHAPHLALPRHTKGR
jgi:RNA polymerase sigma factor (sigma-70 family)